MGVKRYRPEEIITKLREAEVVFLRFRRQPCLFSVSRPARPRAASPQGVAGCG